ncbi:MULTISPECIES: ABC transporter ATP-binding protein [Actinomycetes]|uniref:ABC transporter ATP-binding protein n=6 Tax=Actinomycetes TaxID=1760 RepID=A0A3Q9NSS8_BREAU|nr:MULTISPECIES: ABC transporter ATP-binding protein [Actinomycetes]MDN5585306.1 ABC transporter ATP-binding protein [Brevibacterium sp.]AHI20856.1 antimicrobial peptide ABC transporter ATPase [Corynebacterium casei LMG S-19264]AZT94252.1 ABC transporter ATP-binding protein [Brevibacterium aurantiacum]KAB1946360.1 ABC transporter ATP-binding protein [Brevibacterium linens ATCC 9172]SMX70037.1 putative ABC transport system ATP-binding protein [Brevibacterium antiquum]
MNTAPTIHAEQIVKLPSGNASAQQLPILRDCSVDLGGGLTAVVGPSGAGKTSLLYCLSGLDRPDRGQVSINGTDLYAMSDERRTRFLRQTASFVFQQYNLIGYLTVEENVRLPHALAKHRVEVAAVEEILSRFGLLEKRAARVNTLSGGEQQRAALCRAILMRPSVIFADEPTGALDTANTAVVLRVLRELATQECSVIMVTHDVESAALADRIVFMRDGTIAHVTGQLGVDDILHTMARLGGR